MSTETLALTPEMLKDLVASAVSAAVAESKKPAPPTAQEIAQMEQDQENRAANAQSVLDGLEQKRAMQRICTHEHTKREGGGTHCVHVKEENPMSPGYILCQKCQVRVRPESHPRKLDPHAMYDTALFNKLFQDCNEGELLG